MYIYPIFVTITKLPIVRPRLDFTIQLKDTKSDLKLELTTFGLVITFSYTSHTNFKCR